jgi:putative transposase
VVDYVAKVNLACTVTVTKTTRDAIGFFEAALAEVEVLLGVSWVEDLTDPDTGEIGTLRLVTDNGSCFTSRDFARWVASKKHLVHIRTRKKAPWTNGVIERFFGALKYEDLYRHDLCNGVELAQHVTSFRTIYNSIRPHEAIGMARPLERYRQDPDPNLPATNLSQDLDTGHRARSWKAARRPFTANRAASASPSEMPARAGGRSGSPMRCRSPPMASPMDPNPGSAARGPV